MDKSGIDLVDDPVVILMISSSISECLCRSCERFPA
jgi:hypothetical protein